MKQIQDSFVGVRDASIAYQAWIPDGDVAAALLVVHGLGEHCGRYENLVQHCCPCGYAVYGLDHLGHGRSEGERQMVESFAGYTDTLRIFAQMVASWQPGKPLFLVGHSMGGLIAADYLLAHPADFAGAILSAPTVMVGDDVTPLTILVARLLAALAPRMGVMALDANSLSRDPGVVAAYEEDPLVSRDKTPARLGIEMLRAMERVMSNAGVISLPLLILQGSDDMLSHPQGAQMLYDLVSSSDKTLKVYEGLYHEVFNEPERDTVLSDVADWLGARV
jgi:acylglycerol lipase